MERASLLPYVSYVVDDAPSARRVGADPHAHVQTHSWIIGWQSGFEPLCVAVHSYLPGVLLDEDEAVELAADYLDEIGWFTHGRCAPDIVCAPEIVGD